MGHEEQKTTHAACRYAALYKTKNFVLAGREASRNRKAAVNARNNAPRERKPTSTQISSLTQKFKSSNEGREAVDGERETLELGRELR